MVCLFLFEINSAWRSRGSSWSRYEQIPLTLAVWSFSLFLIKTVVESVAATQAQALHI